MNPAPRPDAPGRLRRAAGFARAQGGALARDPLFFATVALMVLKSYAAVLLINTPDHAALDLAYRDAYRTSLPIFASFIVVPAAAGLLIKGRGRLAWHLGLNLAFSLLLIADLWYFRAYRTFLSLMLWQERGNLAGLWDSVVSLARPVDLLFLADLALLVPAVVAWRSLYRSAARAAAAAVLLPAAAAACLAAEHWAIDIAGDDENYRFAEPRWEARESISFQSPLGFHVLDVYNVLAQSRPLALTPAECERIRSWYAATREALPDNRYRGLLAGRNLIVVQVESLESFVIGRAVAGQAITPTLDGLLPSSLYFASVHDQVHEGSSSDADLMTNTSVYPVRKGSTFFRFPRNSYNSLPLILRGAGYRATLAMHPDPAVYWNWKNALTAIGFDACLDESAFVGRETLGLGLPDEQFLAQAATRIAALPEPFYAFMVTLTSHAPFDLPDRLCELELDPPLADSPLGRSFQAFRYTDRAIGGFLERLRRGGLLDRSVVVFYGDHASVHRFYNDEV